MTSLQVIFLCGSRVSPDGTPVFSGKFTICGSCVCSFYCNAEGRRGTRALSTEAFQEMFSAPLRREPEGGCSLQGCKFKILAHPLSFLPVFQCVCTPHIQKHKLAWVTRKMFTCMWVVFFFLSEDHPLFLFWERFLLSTAHDRSGSVSLLSTQLRYKLSRWYSHSPGLLFHTLTLSFFKGMASAWDIIHTLDCRSRHSCMYSVDKHVFSLALCQASGVGREPRQTYFLPL